MAVLDLCGHFCIKHRLVYSLYYHLGPKIHALSWCLEPDAHASCAVVVPGYATPVLNPVYVVRGMRC